MTLRARSAQPINGSERLIDELRSLVDGDDISETVYRRLMLTAMADLQTRMAHLEDSVHRDWTPVIVAVVVAVITLATVWLRP